MRSCARGQTDYNGRVQARWLLGVTALAACGSGGPPDILGLVDQTAVVGQQLVMTIDGVDPDGDSLTYSVSADIKLDGNASMTQTPTGRGLFRWTPIASDFGMHFFDFTVSDGHHHTTQTIVIDVRAASGAVPVFRQPLGAGRVVNLANDPCMTIDIVVEDEDTAQVTLGEEEPAIAGATLDQLDGTTGKWRWCPTPAQVAESERYTLTLSADDGDHPKTIKTYVIVLSGAAKPAIVINEVDYDNVGVDTAEYLELYNPSSTPTSLAGLSIVLVNGATNRDYDIIDLTPVGSLTAGQYLVIAGASVTVPASAIKLDPLWTQDAIQNGGPDGIAVVDMVKGAVVDAISYEGSITAAMVTGLPGPINLVEGQALSSALADSNTVTATLCRLPNGVDTNDAMTDWRICSTRTIGTANTQ
jgi:hypothetical protein